MDEDAEKGVLILARELAASALERYQLTSEVLTDFPGKLLEGLQLQHPFYDRQVPVILADFVTLDTGTGQVHIAPGHGHDDYLAGLKYGLKVDNPVGDDGKFYDKTPLVGGQSIWAGNSVTLDGSKSWSAAGAVQHLWRFDDHTTAQGARTQRTYRDPGRYAEVLEVRDSQGNVAYDFAIVHVLDREL